VEHTLAALEARQVEWIKLDATEMGAPLYRQLGFEDAGRVARWRAWAQGDSGARPAAWSPVFADLDLHAFGVDRSRLLTTLAPLGAAAVSGVGYGMARPGSEAAYFGPCVTASTEAARELLAWFLSLHRGAQVYWDLLPDNTEAVRLARAFGFEPVRRLVRMVRLGAPGAAPIAHADAHVFAIAGFEWG
jgi:hypothetical protein